MTEREKALIEALARKLDEKAPPVRVLGPDDIPPWVRKWLAEEIRKARPAEPTTPTLH